MAPVSTHRLTIWLSAVVLAAVSFIAACDNVVQPFVEEAAGRPYFVYGYLDSGADTQFVRISPITETVAAHDALPLDATVRSVDTSSGDATTWTDSLVMLDDGTTGHLYYAVLRVEPGANHRLHVVRSDGSATTATTRVPPTPSVHVDSARVSDGTVMQDITWRGVAVAPFGVVVTYHVSRFAEASPRSIRRSHLHAGRLERSDWIVSLPLAQDRNIIAQALGVTDSEPWPALYGIEMTTAFGSESWYRPEVNTVTNGAGFFGSVGRFSTLWTLPVDVVEELRMTDRQGR